MLYNPPSGATDPNAPFVGKVVAAGQQGSKVPRAAVENTQREIVAVIGEVLNPSNADLSQMLRAIRSGQLWTYSDTSASANQIIIAPKTAHVALLKGLPFRIFPAVTNTGAISVSVNNLVAPLKTWSGNDPAPNDIVAGRPLDIVFDGTNFIAIRQLKSETMALIASQAPAGSIITNGYFREPNTGFTIQWGTNQVTSSAGSASVTFPRAFSTVFSVIASDNAADSWSTSNASFNGVGARTLTGFQAQCATWNGSTVTRNVTVAFGWHAFGLS